MKHIGIDARLLFQTGVGTYLQNLLHYLPPIAPKEFIFTIYCLPQDASFVKKEFVQAHIHTTPSLWHSWSEQTEFLSCINKDNLDLMHFTYFGHPVLYSGKYISTIHDVTPLLFKTGKASTKNPLVYALKQRIFSFVLKNQAVHSKAIITPTNTVKNQLISLYGNTIKDKITPIYEGISYRLESEKGVGNVVSTPYLLYVGNFYPHKNIKSLIRAFIKSNSKFTLILAGPNDYFLKRILASFSQVEIKNVIIKDKQSLSQLVFLYKNAAALIHPSCSEGFGLPLVEAMYFNIPIIASHIPVFQELLGTSYYSFDPFEQSSMVNAIKKFESEKYPKKNILTKEFSFSRMAQKTMDLYLRHV